jgi:hypothetical protein
MFGNEEGRRKDSSAKARHGRSGSRDKKKKRPPSVQMRFVVRRFSKFEHVCSGGGLQREMTLHPSSTKHHDTELEK